MSKLALYSFARTVCCALSFAVVMIPTPSGADETAAQREDALKAAYLVNFIRFVEWPPGTADEELTVCFLGGTGVRQALASGIEAKRVGPRRLTVRSLDADASRADCHVVYVDSTASSEAGEPTSPALTVSDAADFVRRGGMIQLFTEQNRLRFNINVENAHRAGLRISSALLQLASAVERKGS